MLQVMCSDLHLKVLDDTCLRGAVCSDVGVCVCVYMRSRLCVYVVITVGLRLYREIHVLRVACSYCFLFGACCLVNFMRCRRNAL